MAGKRAPYPPEPNVFVTDRCGRDCLYCSARGEDRLMTPAQIREVLDRRYPALVFEGGEPLLSPDLERRVRAAVRRGTREITVLTNGLALTPRRFSSLRRAGVSHFHFNFPSHVERTHDELTGTRGRLKAQAAVIKRVAASGPRAASLVCVVNSLNYRQLPDYAAYAARNFPGLFYVAFNFIKVKGRVRERPWLVPDLRRVSPYLRKALAVARRLGLPCLTDGVPLCFLKGFEAYARDADCLLKGDGTYLGEKRRVAACRSCGLSPVCAGPRADYLELRGEKGFKAAPAGAAAPVMRAVAGGQLSLNRPGGGAMRRPDHLSVYLTGSCDMACAYCFVPSGRDALDRAGLFRALDSFARAGGRRVTFLGGEPLLRWGLLKAAVARLGRLRPPLHTTVFTNGALLDQGRAETLLRCGARVVLSLDGGRADNDRSRKLRAGGSAYAAALRGLPRPLRAKLTASAVVTPGNAGRLAANVRALYSAGFRAIAWAPDVKAGWGPAEARILSAELRRIGRDYAAMLRSGRPAYELANIYELLDLGRGADVSGCASLTLSPSVELLPCDKLLAAPVSVRRGYSGPAGRRRFFAEVSAAGADPAEPLCPAGYYSLLRHARGLSPSETRAAMDLRTGFSRVYGAAMLRLVRDLSRLPAFRRRHGLEAPL